MEWIKLLDILDIETIELKIGLSIDEKINLDNIAIDIESVAILSKF